MQQPLELDAFIQWEGLPSLPSQLTKTINQVSTASSMNYDIVEMIKYDVAIACRILKQANSPLYGYAGKIFSLQQACGLLGLEMIKNIVFSMPAVEFYQDTTIDPYVAVRNAVFWKNLAISGVVSEYLGGLQSDLDADVCFAAGLIHGIGKIALAVSEPALLQECQRCSELENISSEEAVQKNCGFSHLDVGRKLATAWGYPSPLIDIFNTQNMAGTGEVSKLSVTVQWAIYITGKLGYYDGFNSVADKSPMSVWSEGKFKESDMKKSWPVLEDLAKTVDRSFTD
ncbi:MAG: HDOD domain-containing protein [Nitrospinales bacterium]